jgi:hypothetical protein
MSGAGAGTAWQSTRADANAAPSTPNRGVVNQYNGVTTQAYGNQSDTDSSDEDSPTPNNSRRNTTNGVPSHAMRTDMAAAIVQPASSTARLVQPTVPKPENARGQEAGQLIVPPEATRQAMMARKKRAREAMEALDAVSGLVPDYTYLLIANALRDLHQTKV